MVQAAHTTMKHLDGITDMTTMDDLGVDTVTEVEPGSFDTTNTPPWSSTDADHDTPLPDMPGRPTRPGKIAKALTKYYGLIGIGVFPRCQSCGQTIVENAESAAMAWEQLARENVKVKRVMERLTESSATMTVIMANAPIVTAIFSHHIIPTITATRTKKSRTHQHSSPVPDPTDHSPDDVPRYTPPDSAVL